MIGKDINKAAEFLKAGKVVGIPTETVYGLAANALNEEAVVTIFEVKKRPFFDPLIIHVPDWASLEKHVELVPPLLEKLGHTFMPGPLTLLLEKKKHIPDLITAGSPKVAIRIPAHPLALQLLKLLDFPLAAPSANPFGYISPTAAIHVEDQLGEVIPYILDGGPSAVGLESTIVGLEKNEVTIYRKGGLEVEKIQDCIGRKVIVQDHSSSHPQAPGMLTSHYAPKTPFYLESSLRDGKDVENNENTGFLRFMNYHPGSPEKNQRILSATGEMHEAARNIFRFMRELDNLGLRAIYAELLPETGLGLAINDRLRRASVHGAQ